MNLLEHVLDFLADNGIRATFGAVGATTGVHPQSLRHEPQFRDRDPRTAWVVYARSRQPPPGIHAQRPDDSELITDGEKLDKRVSGGRQ
jgi:peptidoglycan/xylan/chitin deacetylase (PgdA/CDA1 family)